jgi:predicted DNA-binding transcriptional regulator AlpA
MDLSKLITEAPGINITVSAGDLKEFATLLISQTKEELEQSIMDGRAETYLSTEKVLETLGISDTTLWRWKKKGLISPVRIGGSDRYRLSDINKLMEEEQ